MFLNMEIFKNYFKYWHFKHIFTALILNIFILTVTIGAVSTTWHSFTPTSDRWSNLSRLLFQIGHCVAICK